MALDSLIPKRLVPFFWLALAAVLIGAGFGLTSYQTDLYRKLILWVTLAVGFNFLFGIAGQIALSHFAFYGVGAYAVVILTFKWGVPFAVAVLGAVAVCAVIALIVAIPAARLEGFYLALATLALAQLLIVLLRSGGEFTGGAGGISNYKLPSILGAEIAGPWYTGVIVLVFLGTLAVLLRLDRSYFGRACRAVRDNPEAAEAMGVNVALTKVIVFTLTSVLAGVAGIAYAFVDNTVNPDVFSIENGFTLLFMVIVGGSGRHSGAVVGAVLLYMARPILEPYIGHSTELIYGAIVLFVILFWQKGLIGLLDQAIGGRLGAAAAAARDKGT